MYLPLVLVRKLKHFSITSLVADVFILFGLAYIIFYDITSLVGTGLGPGIVQFNPDAFPLFLGTAIFAFEGVGIILPINYAMKEPKKFGSALTVTVLIMIVVFFCGGALSYLTFGSEVETVVLLNFPAHSRIVMTVQLLYSIAIAFTVPLMAFPALKIIESLLVVGEVEVWRRRWKKNGVRMAVVVCMAVVSCVGASDLDRFVSLVGAFSCVPLSL